MAAEPGEAEPRGLASVGTGVWSGLRSARVGWVSVWSQGARGAVARGGRGSGALRECCGLRAARRGTSSRRRMEARGWDARVCDGKEMGALWVMVAWNGESLGDLGR